MNMASRIARGHTQALHLRRDAEKGKMRGDEALDGRDKESEDTCARGAADVPVGSQGQVALPSTTHELGISQSLQRVYMHT